MAVTKNVQRKLVELAYDTETVKGQQISVEIGPDGEEVRTGDNDGLVNITFPEDYTGDVEVTVRGSKGTSDTGTITVE